MSNEQKKTEENNESVSEETKETELEATPEKNAETGQNNQDNAEETKEDTETTKEDTEENEIELPKSRISQKTIMALGVVIIFVIVGLIFFFSIELPPTGQIVMNGLSTVEPSEITTFSPYEMDTCTDNGKPTVIQFSTSTCPHCSWIEESFKSAVKPYVAEGKISAYLWNLDTGDNLLTEIIEPQGGIPRKHLQIFSHFDTQQQVPFFVMGCRYYRLGTAYEIEGGKEKEVAEMKAVIEQVIKDFEEGK